MELNPAYTFAQPQSNESGQELYEEIDLPTAVEQPSIVGRGPMPSKTGGKQRGVNVVLAIVIAIIVPVLLTSNSKQEIQSLQLEVENLKEMLNQTERDLQTQYGALAVIAIIVPVLLTSNSKQEIQSLQLEVENLKEMLNQTERDLQTQYGEQPIKHMNTLAFI